MDRAIMIYGLVDACGTVRYVGQTVRPVHRLRQHRSAGRSWIAGMLVLDQVPEGGDWIAAERRAIAHWGQWGDLENQNAGGNAFPPGTNLGNKHTLGMKHTPEARAKIAAGMRGNRHGAAHRGKKRPELGAALRGRPLTPEHRAALSSAHLGNRATPETRAKMSAAQQARRAREASGA